MVAELGPTLLYDFLKWWFELLVFSICTTTYFLYTHELAHAGITTQEMPDKARLAFIQRTMTQNNSKEDSKESLICIKANK